MDPRDAVQFLAAILIFTGLAVYRLPLRCGHTCQACEYSEREARRKKIADAHYWHLAPHPECWKCDEDKPRR